MIDVIETTKCHKTTFNTPEYKGANVILDMFYQKTINSDPNDYSESVLAFL